MPQIILLVRFRLQSGGSDKELFKQHLIDLFNTLAEEPAFVNAIIHENLNHPTEFMVYEIWNTERDQFLIEEMTKPYRKFYENVLIELGIEREVDWLVPVAEWGSTLTDASSIPPKLDPSP